MLYVSRFPEEGQGSSEPQSPPDNASDTVEFKFYYNPTPNTSFNLIGMLKGRNLYIETQTAQIDGFSKEAFISVLEHAEDVLRCDNVVVYFPKDSSQRAGLIRNFMFMGFNVVPPGDQLGVQLHPDNIYMMCKIQ